MEDVLAGGREEWGGGGGGWFGRRVLGQEQGQELEMGSGGWEDAQGRECVEDVVDKVVVRSEGQDGEVGLEELCERLAVEMERGSLCGRKCANEGKATGKCDIMHRSENGEKSASRGAVVQGKSTLKTLGIMPCSTAISISHADLDTSPTHTTFHLLKHTLSLLSQHPNILTRLQTDLLNLYNTTDPSQMTYLSAILHETRRLHPTPPLHLRQAQKDTYLPHSSDPDHPLLVPKGVYVACLVGSLNRRTELFGLNAEVFKPERWMDGSCRPGRGYGLEEESREMDVVGRVIVDLVESWSSRDSVFE